MTLLPKTESFLDEAERHAGRRFRYRLEIGIFVECGSAPSLRKELEELIFYAKFLSRAQEILKRPTMNPDETEKLSQEFSEKLARIPSLINMCLAPCSAEERESFASQFLAINQASMESLIALLRELSCIKNFMLDGGRLP